MKKSNQVLTEVRLQVIINVVSARVAELADAHV